MPDRILFDLDGTLFHPPPDHLADQPSFWSDPVAIAQEIAPIHPACELVRALVESGHVPHVGYVTGRPEYVREPTTAALQDALLPSGPLACSQGWAGWDAYISHKADALTALDASLYIGDLPQDQDAAELANVPFLHAQVFHQLAGVP